MGRSNINPKNISWDENDNIEWDNEKPSFVEKAGDFVSGAKKQVGSFVKGIGNLPQESVRQFGGIMQSLGEGVLAPPEEYRTKNLKLTPEELKSKQIDFERVNQNRLKMGAKPYTWDEYINPGQVLSENVTTTGSGISKTATGKLREKYIKDKITPETEFSYGLGTSAAQQIPGTVASVLTKSPTPMLTAAGASSFGGSYASSREQGIDPEKALTIATGTAAVEILTGKIPIDMLLKPGKGIIQSAMKQAFTEGTTEAISQGLQYGLEKGVINEKMNLNEAWSQMKAAGLGGFILGGAMSALTQPITRYQSGDRSIQEEPEIIKPSVPDLAQEAIKSIQEQIAAESPDVDFTNKPLSREAEQEIFKNIAKITGQNVNSVRGKLPEVKLPDQINRESDIIEWDKPIDGKEVISGSSNPIQTENQIEAQTIQPKTIERRISQTKDISQGMGEDLRVKPPKRVASSLADTGGYEIDKQSTPQSTPSTVTEQAEKSPIQMPELVELAKAINNGKAPIVKEKLRKNGALGVFYPGSEDIKLRADIFKEPKLATRVLAHEIGHLADYLPDETMSRGNIIGRVATLKKYTKSILDDAPPVIKKDIVRELKDLSMRWKPFDPTQDKKYTAYRNSSPELYADAISVLFNDPTLLKNQAPNFYKAFFDYLDRKPIVKRVYEDIQNRLTNPDTVGEQRIEGVYKMLEEGNKAREEAVKRGEPKIKGFFESIERALIDRDQPLLKQVRKGKKQGGGIAEKANLTQQELEETKYMAAETNDYISSLNESVMKPLQEAGLSVNDIGAYMLAKRAATERATLANPRGLDEEAAKRLLADLKTKLGSAKFAELEKAVKSYRDLRENIIIPKVEDAGMYSSELIALMKESKNYAKFSVTHYLEEKFGGQGTARVYKQIGTLADIENPFISTVVQDISMLRAAKMNQAKNTTLDFLKSIGEASEADKVFDANVQGQVAKDPKDPEMKLFSVLNSGKMESYYVHKDIAESFERNSVESNAVANFMSTITNPLKQILVSKNPIWMARNVIRDWKATVKNVPEIRLRDIPKLAKYYNQAFREVVQEVFKGERSNDIAAMYKSYMLNPNRVYSGRDYNFDNEIERLVAEFQVSPNAAIKKRGIRGRLKQAWDYLDKFGRASELTGKVAGYKYLKSETNLSQSEIGRVVRTRIGTPDARRQGALHQITNNVFMFSNIGKEGVRSSVETFNANRGAFIWKTMMINVLPKLVLVGAMAAGPDELKELIAKIPEYDKQMYDIVPIGLNKAGKAVYLRIPQDYEGQLWGALAWAISGGKFIGPRGVFDTIGEQSPYSLNPILKVAGDLYTYYVRGQNPTDDYRGQPVIPRKAFTAGGVPASLELAKYESKNLGASPLYSFGDYSDRSTSAMEKVLKLPGLNVLGAFLKVSDKGEIEKFYAEEDKENQENSKRLLKIENRVIESIKSKKELPTVSDMVKVYGQVRKEGLLKKGTTFPEFKAQYIRYASKVVPDSDLKLLLKSSKADRLDMLKKIREEKGAKEYAKLVNGLNRMGVSISAE